MNRSVRRRVAVAALALTTALVPTAAFAAKGAAGGGGGTSTAAGVIKVGGSTAPACDNGTTMSVSIGKGRSGQTSQVLVMSGNTGGFWMYRTAEVTSGRNVVSFGGNQTELGSVSSVQTVVVNSWLPKGTWDLSFTATRTELAPGAPIDATGTLLETCTGQMTVVVG